MFWVPSANVPAFSWAYMFLLHAMMYNVPGPKGTGRNYTILEKVPHEFGYCKNSLFLPQNKKETVFKCQSFFRTYTNGYHSFRHSYPFTKAVMISILFPFGLRTIHLCTKGTLEPGTFMPKDRTRHTSSACTVLFNDKTHVSC